MTQDILGNAPGKSPKGKPVERGNFIIMATEKILEITARDTKTSAP
jgi:hypothetical protein